MTPFIEFVLINRVVDLRKRGFQWSRSYSLKGNHRNYQDLRLVKEKLNQGKDEDRQRKVGEGPLLSYLDLSVSDIDRGTH